MPDADQTALRIHTAFRTHQEAFLELTGKARQRFVERDWHGLQHQAAARLDLYPQAVGEITATFEGRDRPDRSAWADIKASYIEISSGDTNAELARTFFNSVTRRVFATTGVDPMTEFVEGSTVLPESIEAELFYEHPVTGTTTTLVREVLAHHDLGAPYAQLERDVAAAGLQIDNWLRNQLRRMGIERVQTMRSVFYRNKGCYIVGRMIIGGDWNPFVLALTHGDRGIEIDAVLMDENDVSILFSFARSYFHVDIEQPRQMVTFLRSIMPLKPLADLYTSLGFHKHGKAEQFRSLVAHLDGNANRFESAAIDRGMVMLVFGLPGYDQVFKVIRDRFAYPKRVTREEVRERYELVFRRDRVGRLVDAQEFEQLRFRRDRFDPELLEEILRECGSTVDDDGETLTFAHLYTERRVTPLNLYLREAEREPARRALLDYGRAIKELAAANVFPGDFLLKNFGVTRHGRVVFYDYDELCRLSDCRFRDLPPPRDDEDEMSAEPWFGVGEHDIFPEEFRRFLGLPKELRSTFETHHGDLFTVRFWKDLQERHRAGEVVDIFPYPARRRLRPTGL
ncbi:MAG: bifunctional isocitrate dehydrogenase kinase/phosphatase [Acidobacteria bacterium]|nr:bifunctional isocitrate dehydrogenase kinase/phosphatase [Acidobacteriota bacterium]NIM62037.1 bifunctional isocitrate dehydrogenase kinase/phosphatase [Acidobacteriota bacterium]NIQ85841.1 bifunctional isocitrate dehydrogenase kinase/phosphatase [Acidobacteriota bacterium]NIT11392.1 bifunctional isocitrate dehydrogenase kinase/phosphatase [Acidobacteriota bacterium]